MAAGKHKGYHTIKLLIESGSLNELRDIFDHIPKTAVNQDLGINFERFKKLMARVQGFKLEELYTLSHLIGVEEEKILKLAHNQYMAEKAKKRKV